MDDLVGQQLGEYRLLERIGSGGMGTVYLARHQLMGKTYAVKVLPADLCRDPGFIARFQDEARVMADLHHSHIVHVNYMGCEDGTYFIVMDFVPGPNGTARNLSDELADRPDSRLDESQALTWAIQIAEALAYAHGRGIVHRDIKPANILIDADSRVKLADFGLAKAIGNETILSQIHQSMKTLSDGRTISAGAGPAARTGSRPGGSWLDGSLGDMATRLPAREDGRSANSSGALGTYDYMAPEQRGEFGGVIDQRTDIYAFGVVLYRMLTGRRPAGRFEDASKLVAINPAWDRVIDRCLAPAPPSRYASTEMLSSDLRQLEGLLVVSQEQRHRKAEKQTKPKMRVALWVGVLCVILAGVAVAWMMASSQPSRPMSPDPNKSASHLRPSDLLKELTLAHGGNRPTTQSAGGVATPTKPDQSGISPRPRPASNLRVIRVAVFDMEISKGMDVDSGAMSDRVNAMLGAMPNVQIVNRDQIRKIADEQKLSMSGLVDPASAAKLGKFLAANFVVVGRASRAGETDFAALKLIDVGTTLQTTVTAESHSEKGGLELLARLKDSLAPQVAELQQPATMPDDPNLPKLKEAAARLVGKTVLVDVSEAHGNRPLPYPAAQTSIANRLRKLGLTVLAPRDPAEGWKKELLETGKYGPDPVDYLLEGEGVCARTTELHGLISCRAQVELRLVPVPGRNVAAGEQGVAAKADLTEALAAKGALADAGVNAVEALLLIVGQLKPANP